MKYNKVRDGLWTCKTGHLYIYIEDTDTEYSDDESDRFYWFIAPDDDDKNYRRSIAEGRVRSFDDAVDALYWAVNNIKVELDAWLTEQSLHEF